MLTLFAHIFLTDISILATVYSCLYTKLQSWVNNQAWKLRPSNAEMFPFGNVTMHYGHKDKIYYAQTCLNQHGHDGMHKTKLLSTTAFVNTIFSATCYPNPFLHDASKQEMGYRKPHHQDKKRSNTDSSVSCEDVDMKHCWNSAENSI